MAKKIDLKKIKPEDIFEFHAYYDENKKQLQGQAPYFLVVADKAEGLPLIAGQSKEIKKRKILVVVL